MNMRWCGKNCSGEFSGVLWEWIDSAYYNNKKAGIASGFRG